MGTFTAVLIRSKNRLDFHGIAHEVKNSDFRGRIFRDTARRLRILMLILGESTTVNTLKKKILGPEIEGRKFEKSTFHDFWARNS